MKLVISVKVILLKMGTRHDLHELKWLFLQCFTCDLEALKYKCFLIQLYAHRSLANRKKVNDKHGCSAMPGQYILLHSKNWLFGLLRNSLTSFYLTSFGKRNNSLPNQVIWWYPMTMHYFSFPKLFKLSGSFLNLSFYASN